MLYRAQRKLFCQSNPNLPIVSIFVDAQKAFDSVNRKILFDKLYQVLPLNIARAVHHLYKNDTVGEPILNNPSHLQYQQASGVRQGCPLSPLLFAWYVNGALQSVAEEHTDCWVSAFADDMQIMGVAQPAQQCLDTLVQALSELGLKLSIPKTVCMMLSNQHTLKSCTISILDSPIQQVQAFKYVGSWVTSTEQEAIDLVIQDHLTDIQTISALPLTCDERIAVINAVTNARTSFRFAGCFDIAQTRLAELHEANKTCAAAVTGIPKYAVEKTLQSPHPCGYGLSNLYSRTASQFLLAWCKLSKRLPNIMGPTQSFYWLSKQAMSLIKQHKGSTCWHTTNTIQRFFTPEKPPKHTYSLGYYDMGDTADFIEKHWSELSKSCPQHTHAL